MFSALKSKPYDLNTVYADWKKPPMFKGTRKDDPVAWLDAIKAGCMERDVPKVLWPDVGRNYMGPVPRKRMDEIALVLQKMTGDKHVWNWKKFKIAVQSLGLGKSSKAITKTGNVKPSNPERSRVGQGASSMIDKTRSLKNRITIGKGQANAATPGGPASTTNTRIPNWLVGACDALDFLAHGHPKVMSAISAILITLGSIPQIPAISAGAAGTLLASHAAQAVGAVAVGLGQALQSVQEEGKGENADRRK